MYDMFLIGYTVARHLDVIPNFDTIVICIRRNLFQQHLMSGVTQA